MKRTIKGFGVVSMASLLLLAGCSQGNTKPTEDSKEFKYATYNTYLGENHKDLRDFNKDLKSTDAVLKMKDYTILSMADLLNTKDNFILQLYSKSLIDYAKQTLNKEDKAYIEEYVEKEKDLYKSLKAKYTKEMEETTKNTLYMSYGFIYLLDKSYPIDSLKDYDVDTKGYLVLSTILPKDSYKNTAELNKAKREVLKEFKTIKDVYDEKDYQNILNNGYTVTVESSLNSYSDKDAVHEYEHSKAGAVIESTTNVTDTKIEKVLEKGNLNEKLVKAYLQKTQFLADMSKLDVANQVTTMFLMLDKQSDDLNLTKPTYKEINDYILKNNNEVKLTKQFEFLKNIAVLSQKELYNQVGTALQE